jgi:hypothetical protein
MQKDGSPKPGADPVFLKLGEPPHIPGHAEESHPMTCGEFFV